MATPLTGVQLLDGGGGVAGLSNRVTRVDSSFSSSNGGGGGFNRSSLLESPILIFSFFQKAIRNELNALHRWPWLLPPVTAPTSALSLNATISSYRCTVTTPMSRMRFSAQEDEGEPNPNLLRRTTIGNGPLCPPTMKNEQQYKGNNRCSYVNFSDRSSMPNTSYRGDNGKCIIKILKPVKKKKPTNATSEPNSPLGAKGSSSKATFEDV